MKEFNNVAEPVKVNATVSNTNCCLRPPCRRIKPVSKWIGQGCNDADSPPKRGKHNLVENTHSVRFALIYSDSTAFHKRTVAVGCPEKNPKKFA